MIEKAKSSLIISAAELAEDGEFIERQALVRLEKSQQFKRAFYGGDGFRKEIVFDPSEKPINATIFIGRDGSQYAFSSHSSFSPSTATGGSEFLFCKVSALPESGQGSLKADEGVLVETVEVGGNKIGSIKSLSKDKFELDNSAAYASGLSFVSNAVIKAL